MIQFTVYAEPATQGSMKPVTGKNGRIYIIHDNPKKVTTTRQAIVAAALASGVRLTKAPMVVTVKAYLHKGKSVKREYPTVKPDLDKIERLVLDALKGVAWVDDAQVVMFRESSKQYGNPPRMEITIAEVGA